MLNQLTKRKSRLKPARAGRRGALLIKNGSEIYRFNCELFILVNM